MTKRPKLIAFARPLDAVENAGPGWAVDSFDASGKWRMTVYETCNIGARNPMPRLEAKSLAKKMNDGTVD